MDIDGIYSNSDRVFTNAPETQICKSNIASGEEAYFIKSNYYRESKGLNYHHYSVISFKDGKLYTITINIGHAGDFQKIEKELAFDALAFNILISLELK